MREELEAIEKKKLAKVRSLLTFFNQEVPSTFGEPQPKNNDDMRLAIASMRKLPAFGMKGVKIEFEWPTERDLLAMPKGKPFSVLKLKWKRSRMHEQSIGAIQVILGNGQRSPVFCAKDNDEKGMQVVHVREANEIKRVSGT